MTGNVARITTLMFVVTHVIEFRRTNVRLRYQLFTKQSMPIDPIFIHIEALPSPVS